MRAILFASIVIVAAAVAGCGDYDPAHIAGMSKKIAVLEARVTSLETASPPVPSSPPIPTVLWVQNPDAYPRASAYYSSKDECARIAAQWGFPDDKGAKQVSADPWVTQSSRRSQFGGPALLIISCLPQGVTPFAK